MTVALIVGAGGQDGFYLSRHLLDLGYDVIGTTRARSPDGDSIWPVTQVEVLDIRDQDGFGRLLRRHSPSEVYNLAACSSGRGMFEDPIAQVEVNCLAVLKMLEVIRSSSPRVRFLQASSSEVFAQSPEPMRSEATRGAPRSPYGAAKLCAQNLVRMYREHHALFAASAILFNHESPRRGLDFVTRKITNAAALASMGRLNTLALGNLDAQRDWGFAGDYVIAMQRMLSQSEPRDLVIATGVLHTVRDACRIAFEHVGLDYGSFVTADATMYRPAEELPPLGDASLARKTLNWVPTIDFEAMIKMMVDSDLQVLQAAKTGA